VQLIEGERAQETYRYLRIGLMGSAVLLVAAVILERLQVDCWQGSISAYYYTPARAVFVGTLVAVGLSLIVIKGTGAEDVCLNIAGMLAPVVAFVPTRNVGACFSIPPEPSPVRILDDPAGTEVLADWVIANVANNMWALIITGVLGLALSYILLAIKEGPVEALRVDEAGAVTRRSLLVAGAIIAVTALALWLWDGFAAQAHNFAAVGMFAFLAAASAINAWRERSGPYFWAYAGVAVLMVASAAIILGAAAWLGDRWDHSVLVLEAVEIALFALYWATQTKEHWTERVTPSPAR